MSPRHHTSSLGSIGHAIGCPQNCLPSCGDSTDFWRSSGSLQCLFGRERRVPRHHHGLRCSGLDVAGNPYAIDAGHRSGSFAVDVEWSGPLVVDRGYSGNKNAAIHHPDGRWETGGGSSGGFREYSRGNLVYRVTSTFSSQRELMCRHVVTLVRAIAGSHAASGRAYILIPYNAPLRSPARTVVTASFLIGVSEDAGISRKLIEGQKVTADNIGMIIPGNGGGSLGPQAPCAPGSLNLPAGE